MIVVATEDFEVYHEVVGELRDRGAAFTTVEPGAALPEDADVVIAGPDDDLSVAVDVVVADPEDPRAAVEEALTLLRGHGGRTVVGVDPGPRPGIAVLSGDLVVAVFHVPVKDAAAVVREEVAEDPDPLVRVGDGARIHGARIIDGLDDVTVELVDETGTTPYLGRGARGMDDVLAAVNIARLEGEVVGEHTVEPTAGELDVIKQRSRERSAQNRTITEELARRVAAGELTIDEALERHREE
ncbi:hypothetical protein EFA46_001520 [Halarchaeum sp. CBA1220]|uniref:hypothetical protein n=1 Tax=Halarchaeum sp. CBA1220 TaxID=1853682 RepID=UPI000F3A9FE7|nr:hypothetical protein [Halarchaeum sp. CBA1220]QLC32943.1 hypothetical protein EFA46_001520 [Halarchaeum sp. CBA1220]